MPDGFLVPTQLLRDMWDVKKLVLGGTRSKGKKFRRRRGGGGGGGGTDAPGKLARVVVTITKATSNLVDDWGDGKVWYLGDETGEWVESDQPVVNRWPIEYPLGAMVEVRGSGNIQGICGPAPEGFWQEL